MVSAAFIPRRHNVSALLEIDHVSKRFVKEADFVQRVLRGFGASEKTTVVHAVDDASLTQSGVIAGSTPRLSPTLRQASLLSPG